MQTDTYKTTGFPKFTGIPVSNTPAGSRLADCAGLFDQIAGLIQKNAVSSEAAHYAYTGMALAWGGVQIALAGKPATNG